MAVRPPSGADVPLLALLTLVLAAAFFLGGEASAAQRALLGVELVSVPLLGLGVWRLFSERRSLMMTVALLIALGMVALPLLQLIPLPWSVWLSMPGREAAQASLRLATIRPAAMPISLTPAATWRAFLWMIPPVAMFVATLTADMRVRVLTCFVVLGLVTFSLVLGGLQMAGGPTSVFQIYHDGHLGLPTGLFANRNHQAVALALSLPLGAAAIALTIGESSGRRTLGVMLFVGLVGLFVAGILATRSRAGLAMIAPSLAISLLVLFRNGGSGGGKHRRSTFWVLFAVFVVVVLAAQLGLSTVLARFDRMDREDRFRTWPIIETTAERFFPYGGGLGSFDPVYRSVEPPDTVTQTYLNEAHNDYLQIWLEGGALGLALVAGFAVWFLLSATAVWRARSSKADVLARAASVAALLLLIHSTFDYPLRTMSLACVFAFLTGLVGAPRPAEPDGASVPRRSGRRRRLDDHEAMESTDI
jgi:O-antigen ligase